MARNGTVPQEGNSRIAARLSPTNPTQTMSTQDRWGPPDRGSADPGTAGPGTASARPAAGSPSAGPPLGEGAMAERAGGAARQLSGTRLVRRCVDTISPHLIRGYGH